MMQTQEDFLLRKTMILFTYVLNEPSQSCQGFLKCTHICHQGNYLKTKNIRLSFYNFTFYLCISSGKSKLTSCYDLCSVGNDHLRVTELLA